jgi:dethiobiotin synthetase
MSTRRRPMFVTGTDTGVGKTLVTCAIVGALRARGLDVGVYKPVETGCRRHARDGVVAAHAPELVAEDVPKLVAAGGGAQPLESAASYLFEMPAAPLVAAEDAGVRVEPRRIAADFSRLAEGKDVVVVEGAGGLLVPLAPGYAYLDLARELDAAVVCVVGSRLGCVNHALLTLAVLEHAHARVLGFIVNQPAAATRMTREPSAESNRATIRGFTRQVDLGLFPHVDAHRRDDYEWLARLASEHLDLATICED